MKRVFTAAIMLLTGIVVQAQTMDTMYWGQRRADLYYGSSWIDSNVIAHPGVDLYHDEWQLDMAALCSDTQGQPLQGDFFIGRPCVTNTPLKILGVAAPVSIFDEEYWLIVDTSRLPEYYRVYQHTDDSIILLDEVRWDTTTPQHMIEWKVGFNINVGYMCTEYIPFYEAYFEKPLYVHDTFYVGGTLHNNLRWGMPVDGVGDPFYFARPRTCYHIVRRHNSLSISTDPAYSIRRYFHWSNEMYPTPINNSL